MVYYNIILLIVRKEILMKTPRYLSVFLWLIPLSHGIAISSPANETILTKPYMQKDEKPEYLYKILSREDWEKSQSQIFIVMPKEDKDFIHLSKEDQLNRIIEKYWSHVSEFVILKVKTDQLPGTLVYEANPGGTNQYYHLYEGSIPLKAVVEVKTIKK
jgi:uncharacterized protein (DUF952 family)